MILHLIKLNKWEDCLIHPQCLLIGIWFFGSNEITTAIKTYGTCLTTVVCLDSKKLTPRQIKTGVKCTLRNGLNDVFAYTEMSPVFPDGQIGYLYSWIARFGPKRCLIVEIDLWFREEAHLKFLFVNCVQF